MSGPVIRAADPERDVEPLLDLLAVLDRAGARLPLEQARTILARIRAYPDYTVWIAELERVPVGTYSLLIMDNLGHGGAPAAVVENVAVAPAAQGRGVGTALMRHAMARARARGCYKLALSSNLVRTDAHAFYDRLGFSRHGISFVVDPAVQETAR